MRSRSSGSTATFASALPNNIGVGDVIQYDSDNNGSIDALAFIHGRTNSQTYTVTSRNGADPQPPWPLTTTGPSIAPTPRSPIGNPQTENPNILEPVENDFNPSHEPRELPTRP